MVVSGVSRYIILVAISVFSMICSMMFKPPKMKPDKRKEEIDRNARNNTYVSRFRSGGISHEKVNGYEANNRLKIHATA